MGAKVYKNSHLFWYIIYLVVRVEADSPFCIVKLAVLCKVNINNKYLNRHM